MWRTRRVQHEFNGMANMKKCKKIYNTHFTHFLTCRIFPRPFLQKKKPHRNINISIQCVCSSFSSEYLCCFRLPFNCCCMLLLPLVVVVNFSLRSHTIFRCALLFTGCGLIFSGFSIHNLYVLCPTSVRYIVQVTMCEKCEPNSSDAYSHREREIGNRERGAAGPQNDAHDEINNNCIHLQKKTPKMIEYIS